MGRSRRRRPPPGASNRIHKDLELECIDVADAHPGDVRIFAQEEAECEDALEVDEELERFDEVRAELVRVTQEELEPVDRQEGHQHEVREGQVECAESRTLDKCEIPNRVLED